MSKGQAGWQVGIEAPVSMPVMSIFARDGIWLGRGKDNAVWFICCHGNSCHSR